MVPEIGVELIAQRNKGMVFLKAVKRDKSGLGLHINYTIHVHPAVMHASIRYTVADYNCAQELKRLQQSRTENNNRKHSAGFKF